MIQTSVHYVQSQSWKNALANTIKSPKELFNILSLPRDLLEQAIEAQHLFPLRVPRSFVDRMVPGDINDPLLLQVLPLNAEFEQTPGYLIDPVGDLQAMPIPGLLHKYQKRILLVTTGACGIHCRYCFRRHFPYSDANPVSQHWSAILRYLQNDHSINEVILSGGDPLSLSDNKLSELLQSIEKIGHIKRLRIHTRLPIVIPQRICDSLLEWISQSRLQIIFVVHINHANEVDSSVQQALRLLHQQDVILLNQAVLLRNINDSAECQIELSEKLFSLSIIPYYLHMLDPVQGSAHFSVAEEQAIQIIDHMREKCAGYLVPKLVREQAGVANKTPVR